MSIVGSRFVEKIDFYMALARSVKIISNLQCRIAFLRIVYVVFSIWRIRKPYCDVIQYHRERIQYALQLLILILIVLNVLLSIFRVVFVYVADLYYRSLLPKFDYIAVILLALDLSGHVVESDNQCLPLSDLFRDDC